MSEAKPFGISKWEVWEAYKRVKANKGAAGVDEQSIADFERNLKGNLYKIWNRMSSGSYFPPPVRTVKIPKANGGERKLGIPTVRADCTCAQFGLGMGRDSSSLPPAVGGGEKRVHCGG
jgi:RNA-directed DNA polymerase